MQGISLVLVAAFVIMNMIVDILYAVLDPRVTLGDGAAVSVIAAGDAAEAVPPPRGSPACAARAGSATSAPA